MTSGVYFCFKLSDQGSNLDSSDPETDVLPVTPSDNSTAKVRYFLKLESASGENIGKYQGYPAFSILAHESFSVEMRLKTSFPGLES